MVIVAAPEPPRFRDDGQLHRRRKFGVVFRADHAWLDRPKQVRQYIQVVAVDIDGQEIQGSCTQRRERRRDEGAGIPDRDERLPDDQSWAGWNVFRDETQFVRVSIDPSSKRREQG